MTSVSHDSRYIVQVRRHRRQRMPDADRPSVVSVQESGERRRTRQAVKGLMPRRRHVPKSEASVIFVSLPAVERVPPLIFRRITICRSARSASLLSGSAAGSRTKMNNSCRCFAIRRPPRHQHPSQRSTQPTDRPTAARTLDSPSIARHFILPRLAMRSRLDVVSQRFRDSEHQAHRSAAASDYSWPHCGVQVTARRGTSAAARRISIP